MDNQETLPAGMNTTFAIVFCEDVMALVYDCSRLFSFEYRFCPSEDYIELVVESHLEPRVESMCRKLSLKYTLNRELKL